MSQDDDCERVNDFSHSPIAPDRTNLLILLMAAALMGGGFAAGLFFSESGLVSIDRPESSPPPPQSCPQAPPGDTVLVRVNARVEGTVGELAAQEGIRAAIPRRDLSVIKICVRTDVLDYQSGDAFCEASVEKEKSP